MSIRVCTVLKDSLGGNCRTRMLATVGHMCGHARKGSPFEYVHYCFVLKKDMYHHSPVMTTGHARFFL